MNLIKTTLLYLLCIGSFLSVVLIAAPTEAVEKKTASIDFDGRLADFLDFVKNLQNQGLLDGEVLVARHGKTLLDLQSEYIASSEPHGPQFMIGSVSKQFFAVALLKSLYESSNFGTEELKIADVKRKLHLPISQFLPKESAIWDGCMPDWAHEITLHHLLSHTSGIPNYTASEGYEYSNLIDPKIRWFESYRSTSEIIKLISKEQLLFSPGAEYSYSNTGYVIIAEAIKAITGLPAHQYIQEALFDQIGLYSTANPVQGQWNALRRDPKLSRLAAPLKYDPRGDQKELYPLLHSEDLSVAIGAGSIISTSTDLLKWNQALHKDKTVLPIELYHLLIKANLDEYGYGIGIEENSTGLLLGHSGGIGSYQSLLLYMPEQDLSIVVLSNICYDFDKIEGEFKQIEEGLRDTIPDEKRRNGAAIKTILEKYPNTRGFEMIMDHIGKLFSGIKKGEEI